MILDGKTILVTGGTGSFGRKFIEKALKHEPKAIRVFSRDELKQFNMAQEIKDDRVRYFIGDIKDKSRLYRAMQGVDIVVHAAALKQICACEYNPMEAVKTNIIGTSNVLEAAMDNKVEKALFISTDKAVNPSNLYGATKLAAEKLFIQANSYSGQKGTKFSCSRYGNVIGSRGSVIPLFLNQAKEGEFTITDQNMTRFLISLEQGVDFVIGCLERMIGGEIFIPKLPSCRIMDIAKAIDSNARIRIVGVRAGEKVHEALLTAEEVRHTKEFDNYFVVEPSHSFWAQVDFGGKPLLEGFSYDSQNNAWWLKEEEIKKIINKSYGQA